MGQTLVAYARHWGFTRNETLVIAFLCACASTGAVIRFFNETPATRSLADAYRRHDSVFAARSALIPRAVAGDVGTSGNRAPNGTQVMDAKPGIQPIDINTADAAGFASLPGIGPAIARRIVEYRSANGAFSRLEALMDVAGIGQKKFDRIKPYLQMMRAK